MWLATFLEESAYDLHEAWRRLRDLSPNDHAARIIRLCLVHFLRRLLRIEGKVPPKIYYRMLRIASTEVLPDYEENLAIIKSEGGLHAISTLSNKS